jgi:hypothetical protein
MKLENSGEKCVDNWGTTWYSIKAVRREAVPDRNKKVRI